MRSRYRISVGGVQLDTLDDNLLILDIKYSGLQRDIKTQQTANLGGMVVSDAYDACNRVTVMFELHIYDTAKRNEACQKIAKWAATGGTLVTNDRPGQFLRNVVCEQFPAVNSVRNWTDPLTVDFMSTVVPYWISTNDDTRLLTGKNVSGTFTLGGNVDSALIGVTVTALERFTTLQLTAGDTMLKLTGLDVAVNKQILVDYVNYRYLRVRMRTPRGTTYTDYVSVLSKLDPSSSDNLRVACGSSTKVAVLANGKVSAEFSGRGYWL